MTNFKLSLILGGDATGAKNAVDDLSGAIGNKLEASLRKLSAAVAAAFAVDKVYATLAEFDRLNASLKTVTGSAENASSAMGMIRQFSIDTPFQVSQVTEAFIRLKSLGLDASEASLRSFGNTASAMGKPIMQFVEAVADATTGEFERLKEFGIKASDQGNQVALTFQGTTTLVGKSAREIQEYLLQIGNTTFASGMADQMDTLDGKLSNLSDAFGNFIDFLGNIGGRDLLKASLAGATEFVTGLQHQLEATFGEGVQAQIKGFQIEIERAGAVLADMQGIRSLPGGSFLISDEEFAQANVHYAELIGQLVNLRNSDAARTEAAQANAQLRQATAVAEVQTVKALTTEQVSMMDALFKDDAQRRLTATEYALWLLEFEQSQKIQVASGNAELLAAVDAAYQSKKADLLSQNVTAELDAALKVVANAKAAREQQLADDREYFAKRRALTLEEQLQSGFDFEQYVKLETQKEAEAYQVRLELLKQQLAEGAVSEAEAYAIREKLLLDHQQRLNQINNAGLTSWEAYLGKLNEDTAATVMDMGDDFKALGESVEQTFNVVANNSIVQISNIGKAVTAVVDQSTASLNQLYAIGAQQTAQAFNALSQSAAGRLQQLAASGMRYGVQQTSNDGGLDVFSQITKELAPLYKVANDATKQLTDSKASADVKEAVAKQIDAIVSGFEQVWTTGRDTQLAGMGIGWTIDSVAKAIQDAVAPLMASTEPVSTPTQPVISGSGSPSIVPKSAFAYGAAGMVVNLNLVEAPGVQLQPSVQQNADGSIDVGVIAKQVEASIANNLSRGGGIAPSIQRYFGLRGGMV